MPRRVFSESGLPAYPVLGNLDGINRAEAIRYPGPIRLVECFSEQTAERARLFYIFCSF
jgi:hypothetical protein